MEKAVWQKGRLWKSVVLAASSPQTELRRVNTHTKGIGAGQLSDRSMHTPREEGGDFRGEGRGSREMRGESLCDAIQY